MFLVKMIPEMMKNSPSLVLVARNDSISHPNVIEKEKDRIQVRVFR